MKKTRFVNYFLKIYGVGKPELLKRYLRIGINSRVAVNFRYQKFRKLVKKINRNLDGDDFGKKLQAEIQKSILFLQIIQNFKGMRSKFFRPCRGQRTHTNAKTNRKKKKKSTELQIKKEISQKTKNSSKTISKKAKNTKTQKRSI
jgi:ribosomal protein S13